jgi:hypothetical protein
MLAATMPSLLSRSSHRIALDALTPNRSAAWRQGQAPINDLNDTLPKIV